MEVLVEAAKQVPSLSVLVAVVVYFLRYLERLQVAAGERAARAQAESNERMAQIAETFRGTLSAHDQVIKHLADEISDSKRVSARLAQVILYHDATVKGQNPEAMGSTAELIERIMR